MSSTAAAVIVGLEIMLMSLVLLLLLLLILSPGLPVMIVCGRVCVAAPRNKVKQQEQDTTRRRRACLRPVLWKAECKG